jgi:hypothetical protein
MSVQRIAQKVRGIVVGTGAEIGHLRGWRRLEVTTHPLPQFDRTLAFYQREGFGLSGGRKLKLELPCIRPFNYK